MTLSNNDLKAIESAVATQVAPLADEMRGMRSDVGGLRSEVRGLASEVGGVRSDLSSLQSEVRGLKDEVRGLASEVHSVKLVQDTNTEQLAAVQATLSSHTLVLDALAKSSEHWRTERTFLGRRTDRHETWIHKLAAHLGLKL
jgi:chromosome segregation ATPase